jgi:hypothetical protein
VAALCDLGAPGWEEPWFPHCAFVASWLTDYRIALLCFVVSFLLSVPYQSLRSLGDPMLSSILVLQDACELIS